MTIVEIGKGRAKAADAAQSEVDLRLDKYSGMDGMATRPEPVEGASTAEEGVRKDLIAIRGTKEGLGADAVRKHGSDLQSLRVVTNEMIRGNLAPGQRPEASVLAVRCAVHYLIPAPWTVMLRHTLLIGGAAGSVSERQIRAGEQLGIEALSELKRIDTKAYRDLASQLVLAEVSPCHADVVIELGQRIRDLQQAHDAVMEVLSSMGLRVDGAPRRVLASVAQPVVSISRPNLRRVPAGRIIASAMWVHRTSFGGSGPFGFNVMHRGVTGGRYSRYLGKAVGSSSRPRRSSTAWLAELNAQDPTGRFRRTALTNLADILIYECANDWRMTFAELERQARGRGTARGMKKNRRR